MDVAEGFDVILVGIEDHRITIDKGAFLLNTHISHQGGQLRSGIDRLHVIALRIQDLDDLDGVAAGLAKRDPVLRGLLRKGLPAREQSAKDQAGIYDCLHLYLLAGFTVTESMGAI